MILIQINLKEVNMKICPLQFHIKKKVKKIMKIECMLEDIFKIKLKKVKKKNQKNPASKNQKNRSSQLEEK